MPDHDIPTHLDIEDRLLFHLTIRQCLFIVVGASLGYAAFHALHLFPLVLALGIGLFLPLLAGVLGIMTLAGYPLEHWLAVAGRYALRPRVYVWRLEESAP